jgi:hypothetical protein
MRTVLVASLLLACKSHTSEPVTAPPAKLGDAAAAPPAADARAASTQPVALPGGDHGIGFDDLRFAPGFGRVVAPAGGTGNLALIDPATHAVTTIGGFGTATTTSGHENGTTSADEGGGYLYAIDRTQLRVVVIDEKQRSIVGSAPLASSPDYVRWVGATHELWVTQPDEDRIEIFSLAGTTPKHAAFVAVKGGPESLAIGATRAYTHLWDGSTVVLDLAARKQLASWPNGCKGSRGIALDAAHDRLFVGCAEGKAVALAASTGKQLGTLTVGAGVDVIDYNPRLAHLYVPSAKTATLSIVGVAGDGQLTLLGTAETSPGSHCVTADDRDTAWVCDVEHGRLLAIADPYPATK